MGEVRDLIELVESLGWETTKEGDNSYYLSKFSPAGQDFGITIYGSSYQELLDSIYEYYENFDVSQETYYWLDDSGHGINGAPYEMRDVLEDMEACKRMILDLYNSLWREVNP